MNNSTVNEVANGPELVSFTEPCQIARMLRRTSFSDTDLFYGELSVPCIYFNMNKR